MKELAMFTNARKETLLEIGCATQDDLIAGVVMVVSELSAPSSGCSLPVMHVRRRRQAMNAHLPGALENLGKHSRSFLRDLGQSNGARGFDRQRKPPQLARPVG